MRFTIKTIGCKVNTYESNKIKAALQNAGLIFIDVNDKESYKDLDYYIINTCSVTSIADKKSRQMIHQAKNANRDLKVVATGCYVDAHIDELDSEIDLYFKNADKMLLIDKIIEDAKVCDAKEIISSPSRIREFIKIQDGCNQYCTYCIIPFLRGNINSRDDDEIIEEISEKVRNGTKEIVLTGIHLSSFGLDRKGLSYESEGAIDIARDSLIGIIRKIADISVDGKAVERIRLGSLEPRIINDKFLLSLKEGKIADKFCANFCLSLQSGSDKILKSMNRHYNTKDFSDACDVIRRYLKDATITTDIIVGFPGETEEDFEKCLSFVKRMRFYNPNVFPYSKRPGTKACEYENQVSSSIKHNRCIKMISECEKITKEIEKEYDISKHPILVEEIVEKDGKKYQVGYTKEYIKRKIEV